jgi:hypothetical protein
MASVEDIDVRWIRPAGWRYQAQWLVLKPFSVMDIIIPKGFISDGATSPLLFRWLFPPTDRYFAEAIMHDFLLQQKGVSRKMADELFNEALKHCDISEQRRWAMYQAVKLKTWLKSI